MAERIFCDFEHDREDGARPEISKYDRFSEPADQVRKCKEVEAVVKVFKRKVAILAIVLLVCWSGKTRIKPLYELSPVLVILPSRTELVL
jgi:hypothetical protein